MNKFELSEDERLEVAEVVDELFSAVQPWDSIDFADRAGEAAQLLPVRLRRFLARTRLAEADMAVVSGLPISDDLAPTPTGWELASKTGVGQREELLLMLCGAALGEPFSWSGQQNGRMVHDVCPAPGEEQSLTSASSEVDLALHTEDVHHPCRGDYVSLLCLRNPDAIGTTFVRVDSLNISDELEKVLWQRRFRFHADDSHTGARLYDSVTGELLADYETTLGSVLFGSPEHPYLRIDLDFTSVGEDGDAVAEEAMRAAFESLRHSVERVVLTPGDAVFLDNYRVVHGREPFRPRYDGNDRWLKRVNLIRDVRRIFVETRSRSRVVGAAGK